MCTRVALLIASAQALAPPTVGPADVLTSGLASMARMPFAVGKSTTVLDGLQPGATDKPPKLYEFEACPFCRKAREAITALDMVVDIYPCGRGSRHRADAVALGGKEQFPLLVDGDAVMYESQDIVDYLAKKQGVDPEALVDAGGPLPSMITTALRFGRGASVYEAAGAAPEKLLELYSYDGNQFCRLVREVLCELDLPYRLYSAGKGSPRREELVNLAGKSTCPYLVDPNTGVAMGESADIVAYLAETYGAFDSEAKGGE